MLTEAAPAVNNQHRSRPDGLWLSITDLAAARGISKAAISQAIKRWAKAGVVVSTRKDRRALLVNVAEFDRARGESGDLGRQQGETTKKGREADSSASGDPVFAREQARKAAYDADLAMLKRDEQLARLVPVDELERAAVACGEACVRTVDQVIVNRAEDVAGAVAKNGVVGARTALKDIARELRQRMADEFARLPTSAMSPGVAADEGQN